jgi:predicted acylesterase/phospholipase RssA/CRP-like cAMP-binding protein
MLDAGLSFQYSNSVLGFGAGSSGAAQGRAGTTPTCNRIPDVDTDQIMNSPAKHPTVDEGVLDYLKTASLFQSLTREDFESLDPSPEWFHIKGGETLIQQGDEETDYYLLVNGRLRVFVEDNGIRRSVAYINPGQSVGEMSLITGEPRSATVRAKVDSRLIRFFGSTFRTLMMRRPEAATEIIRTIVHRLRDATHRTSARTTISSIAILPISDTINADAFGDAFYTSLRKCASACFVDRLPEIDQLRGSPEALDALIHKLQRDYRYLLFCADHQHSEWTRQCLMRADLVLVVGAVSASPEQSEVEIDMLVDLDHAMIERVELVLQHSGQFSMNAGMPEWLARRPKVADYHHVRAADAGDFDKLARCITGICNNVVLGGGGARGFAHIGVLKAMIEAHIPIDRLGGTSAGALMAAQFDNGMDFDEWPKAIHRMFMKEKSARDFTFPFGSLVRGKRMHDAMIKLFGDRQIEDLPIRYFAVSSDLGNAKMVVHTHGPLWRAVRASASVPIIGPPLYHESSAYIDGGLFNNLPTDIMKKMFAGHVTACDVSEEQPLVIDSKWNNATLSGWTLLLNRLNPFATPIPLPHLMDIVNRTITLYSASVVEQTRAAADLMLIPPVQDYSLTQFHSYEDLIQIGYDYATKKFEELDRNGALVPKKIELN